MWIYKNKILNKLSKQKKKKKKKKEKKKKVLKRQKKPIGKKTEWNINLQIMQMIGKMSRMSYDLMEKNCIILS